MKLKEHLEDRLKNPTQYTVSEEEKKTIKFEGIETFIYRKLTSTKFRRSPIDLDSEKRVKEAIHLNVSKNEPIKITYPFGAYKSFRVPTYPHVDWAEFFTISYVIRYIAPILQTHEPGVQIYFSSDDVVIELIDNYPRKNLDIYVNSFKNLLKEFSKYFPKNLKVEFVQVMPDLYTEQEYNKELDQTYKEFKERGLTEERKAKLRKGFEFNFNPKGKKDYTDTPQEEFEKIIEDLMYYSEGYMQLKKRRAFIRGEDKVVIFSNKIPNAIDIGSTNVSEAKFWVGIGSVEHEDERYFDRIMSPKQFEKNKESAVWEDVNFLDLPNFDKIPVFNKRFNFVGGKNE